MNDTVRQAASELIDPPWRQMMTKPNPHACCSILIPTECCPDNLVPSVLIATIESPGCPCFDGLQAQGIYSNATDVDTWWFTWGHACDRGTPENPALGVALVCYHPLIPNKVWRLDSYGLCASSSGDAIASFVSCEPFLLVFENFWLGNTDCCHPASLATISISG